jgi:nucleoside-triphosphatase
VTNAVLTGKVHIGKTTVCRAVADLARQRGYCVRGVLTPPILDENGVRLGIEVVNLANGKRRVLARTDQDLGGPHVGPYHFDPLALQWAQDAMARAIAIGCDLLIVDEIGRLELEENAGFAHILQLLETSVVLRSLLVVRATLLQAFRRRLPDLEFITFQVTEDNLRTLPSEIAQRFFLA